jgi:uncharacterized membrane protein YdcZ (DUF606 family)
VNTVVESIIEVGSSVVTNEITAHVGMLQLTLDEPDQRRCLASCLVLCGIYLQTFGELFEADSSDQS